MLFLKVLARIETKIWTRRIEFISGDNSLYVTRLHLFTQALGDVQDVTQNLLFFKRT